MHLGEVLSSGTGYFFFETYSLTTLETLEYLPKSCNNHWFAAWSFWQMKIYGHGDVKLMDGGKVKWVAENRPLTADVPRFPAVTYRASSPDQSMRACRDQVLSAIGTGSVAAISPAQATFPGAKQ